MTQRPSQQKSEKHPRGLYTLFLTEMWERFSYYGMRALLVLFMVDGVQHGGMGLTDETATAIYGLYTAAVYLSALPGGWIADRLLGARRSVWYGGIIIAIGHFILAIPGTQTFYLGLIAVVLGTGLLKPNISAMVGELYPEGGARRDAGFTIFYMGINLGATLGPLACSTLGEKLNWHYGFSAAGVGMVFGLIQFKLSARRLENVGLSPGHAGKLSGAGRFGLVFVVALLMAVIGLAFSGWIKLNPIALAHGTTNVIVGIAVVYFAYALLFAGLSRSEKQHVGVILVLFISSALFWAGFEQCGSAFNLFAERYTERSFFGQIIPAGWFQSLGPFFIIVLAPVMASLWVHLAARRLNPSLPVKFGMGLILLGFGFLVMASASALIGPGQKVLPTWLTATYLIHTVGELCVSPVGLSSVTKLAPRRLVGQMMGTWFLGTSLGNLIAGLAAGEIQAGAAKQMSGQYLQFTIMPVVAGLLLIMLAKPVKRWISEANV